MGYDGIPWKVLYKELLKREFPIALTLWGSNDKSFTHSWLTGAGKNWNLFDTIDIKKYSGDTVHLPTIPLINNRTSLKYSEQLPVPGIPRDTLHWKMTWGVIINTNIGYVYVYSWFNDSVGINFYNALDSLINIYKVNGLILDFRANTGGFFERSNEGLGLLFKTDTPALGLAKRNDPLDHYSMSVSRTYGFYPDTNTFFNGPIAILSSPFSISASDFLIKRLRSYSNVKVFGQTSSSAFASQKRLTMNEFVINYAYLNGWSEEDPTDYLTHVEVPVDFEVSFTPDDVRRGDDTIVKAALEWIRDVTGINENVENNLGFILYQNYPNPFNPTTTIDYAINSNQFVILKVYDILGNEISTLVNKEQHAGNYEITFNGGNLASGVYFYTIKAGSFYCVKKFVLLK